ncbi:translation machinery-associated protein 20 [Colletotrichum spaethianum]|uniref:Translation machinery-associated protein 20 n=1 Tax=Colletotrichum spaethianum TaxID=700344 RepID=A0AA37NZ84_9PEZI|nr:translation machinery-associated protein 20 [Colletotrichum spaethianum]GKT41903.1 translation machinery-associated protein 20 [Colletotrichum spaethianum]
MSADTGPISPARFAEAVRELSLPTLHLKALEIRNSILHLQYSNAQLKPYAEGAATTLDAADASIGRPDPDCVEAIRENDVVIARMEERVQIIREEVEGRGHSWNEFRSKEEVESEQHTGAGTNGVNGTAAVQTTNGLGAARAEEERIAGQSAATNNSSNATAASQHPAWLDGTFQTGTIRNGEIQLDATPAQPTPQANGTGGRLSDDELRRAMEDRMRGLGDDNDEDGGMHL